MDAESLKMKAVVREWGSMVLKDNLPIPVVGCSDILISIKAAAINPVDYKLPSLILGSTVGLDFSGVIKSIGDNVAEFAVGDEVYGKVNGSLANYAIAKQEDIALKPKNLTFAEAAAIPLTYITSLQGLRDCGSLKKGGRVLIIGASGGCGIAALQLAKSIGADKIYAVCSGKNKELVKAHGADEVIDYCKHDIFDYFKPLILDKHCDSIKFDVIYDAATGSGAAEDYRSTSMKLLRSEEYNGKHGQYVAINGGPELWLRQFSIGQKKNQHLVVWNNNSSDLKILSKLAEDGWINEDNEKKHLAPVLDSLLPFTSENIQTGFERLKSRRTTGKIVFDISSEI